MGRHGQRFCPGRWQAGRAVALRVVGAEVEALCDREAAWAPTVWWWSRPATTEVLHVDFRNPDGSRSFCGNGTRSAVAWAHGEESLVGTDVTLQAVDGACMGPSCRRHAWHFLNVEVCAPRGKMTLVPGPSRGLSGHGISHHMEWVDSPSGPRQPGFGRGGGSGSATMATMPRTDATSTCGGHNEAVLHIRTFERGVEAETLAAEPGWWLRSIGGHGA